MFLIRNRSRAAVQRYRKRERERERERDVKIEFGNLANLAFTIQEHGHSGLFY